MPRSLPARRIRFAPLPDPRALDDDDDDDDVTLDDKPCDSLPPPPPPSPSPSPCKPTAHQLLSHLPTTHAPTWHKPKSRNLLRPFPFRRSEPDTHTDPTSSRNEIFTLGTINLFRTSSKAPDTPKSDPSTSSSGWRFRLSSVDTNTTKPSLRHRGTPMLNGRVYGRKKREVSANSNPFANARDEDPEFVEWGYGGMGSVRGAQHAGIAADGKARWERLQSDAAFMAGSSGKKGVGGAAVADDAQQDDGSGMGWVKKRKEAREKAAREAKEKAELDTTMNEAPLPSEPLEHNLTTVTLPTRHHSHAPQSSSESESESESQEEDEDEDEDEEESDQRRRMVLGAGREKVSRHS